ncbi:hypothetical protein D3C79_958730 [compost metagenome]
MKVRQSHRNSARAGKAAKKGKKLILNMSMNGISVPNRRAVPSTAVPIASRTQETLSRMTLRANLALKTAVRETGSASSCFQALV